MQRKVLICVAIYICFIFLLFACKPVENNQEASVSTSQSTPQGLPSDSSSQDSASNTQSTEGVFFAYKDFGHTEKGNWIVFQAAVPNDWLSVDAKKISQDYQSDSANISIWGFYENPGRDVTYLLYGHSDTIESLESPSGQPIYYTQDASGNIYYSFKADNELCILIEVTKNTEFKNLEKETYHKIISAFYDSFRVEESVAGQDTDSFSDL